MIQECIDLKISDTVMTSQERNKFRARRSKRMQSLKHSFKKVVVSHAQLAHAAPDILTTNRRQGIIKIERKGTSSLHES